MNVSKNDVHEVTARLRELQTKHQVGVGVPSCRILSIFQR